MVEGEPVTDAPSQSTRPDQSGQPTRRSHREGHRESGRLDQARVSPALFGFYGCCALVSAGAGMFFFGFFALDNPKYGSLPLTLEIVGGTMMGIGLPGAFFCLHKARQNQ